jgi:hypothetical protein
MGFDPKCSVAALVLLLMPLCGLADDTEWSIVLNGKAVHMHSERDWNESNWGLGFELEFETESRWVKMALGNGFRDSQNEMSYMAGAGLKRRFRLRARAPDLYFDLGAVAFLMTRQDVNHNQPFPGILPAFTVGRRNLALNVTYLPGEIVDRATNARAIDPGLDGILFMQLKVNPRMLLPRSRRGSAMAATAHD